MAQSQVRVKIKDILNQREIIMFIYIPQGKVGRLTKNSPASQYFGVRGLYTDNFSSCAYIACISENKISLMHIDAQSCTCEADLRTIQQEFAWVDEPKSIFIVTRPNSVVLKLLKFMFQRYSPETEQMVEWRLMDNQHDGFHVAFTPDCNTGWHPQLSQYPRKQQPQPILHHPEEDRFSCVQIIEQFIGVDALLQGYKRSRKTFLIYDGSFCSIEASNLDVDTGHPCTQSEMAKFGKGTPLIVIARALGEIIDSLRAKTLIVGETVQLAFDIAPFIEDYLNQNNAIRILKSNIIDLLDNVFPQSSEDMSFAICLSERLANEATGYQELVGLFRDYMKRDTTETVFKKQFIDEFNDFSKHYQRRQEINERKANQAKQKGVVSQQVSIATQHYREKNYVDASALFQNVLQLQLFYSVNCGHDLGTAAYNLGRSLFQQAKFEEAIYFYQSSIEFGKTVNSIPQKNKIQNAILECQEKIEEKNSVLESRGLCRPMYASY